MNNRSDEKKASLAFILATSIPASVFILLTLGVIYWYVTRKARESKELRKKILDFGQTHSHLEGGTRNQISKVSKKGREKVEDSAGLVLFNGEPDDHGGDEEEGGMQAVASFSYGPNSNYIAQAVATTSKTNIGQVSFERIDRRTKVMHGKWKAQMKRRQTVEKYKVYSGPKQNDDDEEDRADQEESMLHLEDEGRVRNSGSSRRESWRITDEPEWITDDEYAAYADEVEAHTKQNAIGNGYDDDEVEAHI